MAETGGDKAVEIFGLVVKNRMLPAKLEKLIPLSFIGQAAVTFYRAKIKAMNDLDMTEEQRKATLADGQDAAEMLLDVETRIGQLLPSSEEAVRMGARISAAKLNKTGSGSLRSPVPHGMDPDRATNARRIAAHPEIVERAKRRAREAGEIVTKGSVITEIREQGEKERTKKDAKSELVLTLEQQVYLGTLDKVLRILPPLPPRNWDQKAFAYASAKAEIIIGRLEIFRHGNRKSISE